MYMAAAAQGTRSEETRGGGGDAASSSSAKPPPKGYAEDGLYEGEEEEEGSKGGESKNGLISTFAMLFSILLLTLVVLLPAILVYVARPGDFKLYSIFAVKINSPDTNAPMEFIRWSIFFYVIMVGYLLVEWLVGVLPYLVLRLLKWSNYSVSPRTRRFVAYFVAARRWFTIAFWILFVAIFGAALLYRTNTVNTLSQGLLGKSTSAAAAAAAAQANKPVRDRWYYVERSLLVFAIFCLFLALAKYLLELVKVNFHRMAFEERVSELNFGFRVITGLYAGTKRPGEKIALGKRSRDVYLVWDRHGDLSSEKRAVDLANDLYEKLVPNNRDHLTMDDFANFVVASDLEAAFHVFDKGGDGNVDRAELKGVVLDLYEQRRLVSLGLSNNNLIIEKLDLILLSVALFLTFTFSIPVFELGGAAVFAIFGLLWTSLGFLFQSTAKQCFEAIVFVFVEHAYDVGDRVVVDNEYLTVERVEIFTTVFRRWDGTAVYIPNSNLASKNIYNVRRSPTQSDFIDLFLPPETPISAIWSLRDQLAEFASSEPRDYTGRVDLVSFDTETDRCKVQLAVEYRTSFQDAALRAARKNKFMATLKDKMAGLDIKEV